MNPFADKTYGEALELIASRYAEREALVFRGRRYTYRDVKAEVDLASGRLLSLGLKAGETLSIWMPNRPEFLWYWLGAAQVGLVPVLLNTRLKREEFTYQLRQSDSRALIVGGPGGFRDFIGEVLDLWPELCDQAPGELRQAEFPRLQHVICCDPPGEQVPGLHDWSQPPAQALPALVTMDDPGAPAMIVYSSGTTSLPKGVLLNHCAWRKAYDAGERAGFTAQDRLYLCVPLFGVLANINGVLPLWVRGGSVLLDERFDARRFMRAVERERCTVAYLLSPMVHKIVDHPGFGQHDLSSLRTGVIAGTDPEIYDLVAHRLGMHGFVSSYGMTETTAPVCRTAWNDPLELRICTHGKPLPDIAVRIGDPDSGALLPPGELGEIQVHGYCVTMGYYNNPEATQKAFTQDGWFRTGDAGELSEDGLLTFRHRLGDGYKHNGFNVSPAEVEAVLAEHPSVAEAQVVGIPDRRTGAIGVAFVIARNGGSIESDALMDFLRSRLASFKLPRHILQVGEFPRTGGTEKVQKFKLRELALERLRGGSEARSAAP